MFLALFTVLLVTVYAADEIPSYIHVCGRKDPNYDQCIVDNINSVKSHICTGIPEFDVSPTEPIIVDEIIVFNTSSLKFALRDSEIRGYCNLEVTSLRTSPDRFHFEAEILLKHFNIDTKYDIDMRLLVPIINKGLIHISVDNLEVKLTIDFKEVIKDGKQVYVSKASTSIYVKTFQYDFDESKKDLTALHEIFRNFVKENEKDILNVIVSTIEKKISELLISVINKIVYNRYELLFPETV